MNVDMQFLFNTAIGVALSIVGWFAKTLYDAVQGLKDDIHQIEVDLPKSYVSKDDFQKTMKHIEDMFQRIYDKLDNKADK